MNYPNPLCLASKQEQDEMKKVPYMNAVGELMYLTIGTRPDITYAIGKLAQFNSDPGHGHWQAVKHIFWYLKGTIDLKLTYRTNETSIAPHPFIVYSDSDHASCLNT